MRHRGWKFDATNSRLAAQYDGTEVFDFDANDFAIAIATAVTGGITAATGDIIATTGAITATAGHVVATAGDARITAGNVRLGAVVAFATTQPTSAVVMKAGTAPSGAITTSVGLFTDGTTAKKIIADGTVSDVQT